MAFLKLIVFGGIGLTIIYLSLSVYSASLRRERLEKDYDADPVPGQTRDAFVATGMAAYRASLRPRLLLLVYVVPVAVGAVIVYVINTN
ncbi:hypothetical protein [Loktanella sp. M215]|uniref:hypothetical protein n=1 Tax=Loktanella sp. M215 TaxID=2675431 RepID=UPI001F2566A2|nr:hypothetical protein [Loktanella sp. M215]MCF7699148.1 hypothetical protein [Loktanella sp. M215]